MKYSSILLSNNMVLLLLLSTTLLLLISIQSCSSFVIVPVVSTTTNVRQHHYYPQQQQQHVTFDSQSVSIIRRNLVPHDMLMDIATATAASTTTTSIDSIFTNIVVATTEADIAKLNDNEFRPIFTGGLIVMFGGLVSTIIVGMIIDSKNLYANLVADSYADGTNDEEFWKNMSDVERTKAQDLLRKVREQSGLIIDTTTSTSTSASTPSTSTAEITTNKVAPSSKLVDQQTVVATGATTTTTSTTTSTATSDNKKSSMFSDYE